VFAVVNLADIITAQYILPGEANPIYLLTGSVWFVVALKIGVVAGVYFYIQRNVFPTDFMLFIIIMLLLLGTFTISLGVLSNVLGIINPEEVVAAAEVSAGEKIQEYSILVSILYVFPMGLSLLGFKLYEISRRKALISKEYFVKKVWWKRW